MENIALRIWQILYTFVLRVENNILGYSFLTDNTKLQKGYIFYSLQHFTIKLCNFTKFKMLFQAVVIFFPISIFLKISSKRLKVYSDSLAIINITFSQISPPPQVLATSLSHLSFKLRKQSRLYCIFTISI